MPSATTVTRSSSSRWAGSSDASEYAAATTARPQKSRKVIRMQRRMATPSCAVVSLRSAPAFFVGNFRRSTNATPMLPVRRNRSRLQQPRQPRKQPGRAPLPAAPTSSPSTSRRWTSGKAIASTCIPPWRCNPGPRRRPATESSGLMRDRGRQGQPAGDPRQVRAHQSEFSGRSRQRARR